MEQAVIQYDAKQIEIMRRTIAAGTSPDDFLVFLEVCKHRNLNPFAREIYAIVRSGKMTIQVSIDGFRKLAERSGKYRGQVGPYFCGADGIWKEEWLLDTPPVAAKVGVLRSDFDKPVWAQARYKAYVQPSSPTWQKMPDLMTAKCAEALALRKAFPDEMSGLYTHEEMAQAGRPDNDVFKRPVEQPHSAVIETTAVAGEAVMESEPVIKPAIQRMIDIATHRAKALDLTFEDVKRESGVDLLDNEFIPNSFVKINGWLTNAEREGKSSTAGAGR